MMKSFRRTGLAATFVVGLSAVLFYLLNAEARTLTNPTPTPVPTPAQGMNLSLGAATISGSAWDGPDSQPLCAKDKSYVTAWKTANGAGAWLEIDLGRLCRVAGMVIVHPSIWDGNTSEDLEDYEISVRSDSESAWETVLTIHNNGQETYNLETFASPRDFRYARLVVTDPALGPGSAAKIQEWQIWGEPLVQPTATPVPGPGAEAAREALDSLMAHRNDYNWQAVEADASQITNNPDAEPEVWGRAMIELGLANQERSATEVALLRWQQVKDLCPIKDLAGEAACKKGHFFLTEARLPEAAEELFWAMGQFPEEKSAVWARIDLIDYYGWSREPDVSRALVNEVSELYPLQATIGQKAWADWKGATIGDWEPEFDKEAQAQAFNAHWAAYKDAGGENPDEAAIQARDAAFLAKARVIEHYGRGKQYSAMVQHCEELAQWWPDKKGGWGAGTRYDLAFAYFKLDRFPDSRDQIDILVRDFPNTDFAQKGLHLRSRIDDKERYLNRLRDR